MKRELALRNEQTPWPTPAKTEGRTSFGLTWFATEADADKYAALVEARGDTKNGGYFHGTPCGREAQFDYVDPTLGKLYAVTTR